MYCTSLHGMCIEMYIPMQGNIGQLTIMGLSFFHLFSPKQEQTRERMVVHMHEKNAPEEFLLKPFPWQIS